MSAYSTIDIRPTNMWDSINNKKDDEDRQQDDIEHVKKEEINKT